MASRKTARLPEMFNPDPFAATAVAPTPEPAPEPEPTPAPAPDLRSIPTIASDAEDVEEPAVSAAAPAAPPGRRRLTPNAALPPRDYAVGGRPPAPDLAHVAPVKITAYVRPDQLEALRAEVRRRQAAGQRADVSSLLREAIDAFPATKPTLAD